MKAFCPVCQNRLRELTLNELAFQCVSCFTIVPAEPDDTLRYEEIKSGGIIQHETMLKNLADDPVNVEVQITCPKCGYDIARSATLGEDMRTLYACTKCKHLWL